MNSSFKMSVIIPTRDRSEDLALLLPQLFRQITLPHELIVVDDSQTCSTKKLLDSFASQAKLFSCPIKYVKGTAKGIPVARNLGVKISTGNVLLFLDDDTKISSDLIERIVVFLKAHPQVIGLQPVIIAAAFAGKEQLSVGVIGGVLNAFSKVFMLSYGAKDKSEVRRSGTLVFPLPLTQNISTQRLISCACCFRRKIFDELSFDTNLKRAEDLDFSYRTYSKYPDSLFLLSDTSVIHKASPAARMSSKTVIEMRIVYWFYFFFSDVFKGSKKNMLAFSWAIIGDVIQNLAFVTLIRRSREDWRSFKNLLQAYMMAIRNLKSIKARNIGFFNNSLAGSNK
jgi:glycosyltransferase involved in cell wall biosynthesis